MKAVLWLCFPALLILVAGCGGDSKSPKEKTYEIKGKVVGVDLAKKTVTLDHEDIPGLMKAMEMPFTVADAKMLEGFEAGDAVRGKLKVDAGKYVITDLEKLQGNRK